MSSLDFEVSTASRIASIGQSLTVQEGEDVNIHIEIVEPTLPNAAGFTPKVRRVDLIRGDVQSAISEADHDALPRATVEKRFELSERRKRGEPVTMSLTVKNVQKSFYIRLRGTNTDEKEPLEDPDGEDPWRDLWFYSNPIFVEIEKVEA